MESAPPNPARRLRLYVGGAFPAPTGWDLWMNLEGALRWLRRRPDVAVELSVADAEIAGIVRSAFPGVDLEVRS